MARMDWAMTCSVSEKQDLGELEEFGKWFTCNIQKYAIQVNQLYCFSKRPVLIKRLADGSNSMETVYEELARTYPGVSFIIHILPYKGSPEFDKMKALTCRLAIVGQGILLENALSKFAGADEAAVFQNINQYIARRLSQIVESKQDKNATRILISRQIVPSLNSHVGCSYHIDDLHSTVLTALHSDNLTKFIRTQQDSKHFRNTALVSGLPQHYTRFQVAAIFSSWPVESVLITTRGCAFVDFFDPEGAHQSKARYDAQPFKDSKTGIEYNLSVSPIQSRYIRYRTIAALDKENIPLHDVIDRAKQ